MAPSYNNTQKRTVNKVQKRKSRFRKAPGAPKRFKSAYIFFSTDMMQRIKNQQKCAGAYKQKITDISKRISQAWKMLPPDDRMKWDLIAKKDKERFLAEKRDYKGPWQLPIRTEIEPSHLIRHSSNDSEVALLTSESDDSSVSFDCNSKISLSESLRRPTNFVEKARDSQRLSIVSQEERDAAHNLVSLFRHPNSDPPARNISQPIFAQENRGQSNVNYTNTRPPFYNHYQSYTTSNPRYPTYEC